MYSECDLNSLIYTYLYFDEPPQKISHGEQLQVHGGSETLPEFNLQDFKFLDEVEIDLSNVNPPWSPFGPRVNHGPTTDFIGNTSSQDESMKKGQSTLNNTDYQNEDNLKLPKHSDVKPKVMQLYCLQCWYNCSNLNEMRQHQLTFHMSLTSTDSGDDDYTQLFYGTIEHSQDVHKSDSSTDEEPCCCCCCTCSN